MPSWEQRVWEGRERDMRWERAAWDELMREAGSVLSKLPWDIAKRCMTILQDAQRRGVAASRAGQDFRQALALMQIANGLVPEGNYDPSPLQKDPNAIPVSRPGYTKTPIQPLPEFFLIHFIGGPKSALEEFWEYKKNISLIKAGETFSVIVTEAGSPSISPDGTVELPPSKSVRYRATFIPTNETPFAQGCQVVVALYQE